MNENVLDFESFRTQKNAATHVSTPLKADKSISSNIISMPRKTKKPNVDETMNNRIANIKQSIERINKLMLELRTISTNNANS